MSPIQVGYWSVRGIAEPIHMYLAYKEIPFEKKTYTFSNMTEWTENDKKSLELDFANIPYLIDGDVKICQSNTILRYLEKKYGYYYTGDVVHDLKLDVAIE